MLLTIGVRGYPRQVMEASSPSSRIIARTFLTYCGMKDS